ncbi:hypothetical protein [Paracoccus sp. ME4]|uniref:hypothetical protein n=1 Tax=Paracoccus sp. ME4 TaxID=3138066 RepID=UPI00398B4928
MDLVIDRDCDRDRRITSIVHDPRRHEAVVVCGGNHIPDRESSALELMRMSDARITANRQLAVEIIERATRIIDLGNRDGVPHRETGAPRMAAEKPDMTHFDAALAVVEKRISTLGILTSDDDDWPEKDDSLDADVMRAFEHLRQAFDGTRAMCLVQCDRKMGEEVIMIPAGPEIGRAELRAARHAIMGAARLMTSPADHSNHLDGIHEYELRQAREEADRQEERAALRRSIGALPGLLNGLSDPVASGVRGWLDENRPFPVYRDRKPNPLRDMFPDEVVQAWGPEIVELLPMAMHRGGEDGLKATRALADALSERMALPIRAAHQPDL